MLVTVAICTWNRASLLRQTLERMTQLRVPDDVKWELLVVNNNCTDDTDAVLAEYADKLPLRRLLEPTPGQSNARNCAIRAAQGEYLIWTDDDVLVDAEWIAAYVAAFREYPEAAVFGGPIQPWFEGEPPPWLGKIIDRVGGAFALRELGETPFPLGAAGVPYGANFALKMSVQRRFLFDASLGLRPGSAMRGDETTLVQQVFDAGETGWWTPAARVRHFIPRQRQTVRYLYDFYVGHGEFCGLSADFSGVSLLFGRPRWLVRQYLESRLRFVVRRAAAPPEVWIQDLIRAAVAKGMLRKYMEQKSSGDGAAGTLEETRK